MIPFGEAAAAAIAAALVSASAIAATAAVRFPLHRGFAAGGATAGASEAYGASCGTLSWISVRGGCEMGAVGDGRGGMDCPGGGDAGGGTVTPAGCGRSLWRTCGGDIAGLTGRGISEHAHHRAPTGKA